MMTYKKACRRSLDSKGVSIPSFLRPIAPHLLATGLSPGVVDPRGPGQGPSLSMYPQGGSWRMWPSHSGASGKARDTWPAKPQAFGRLGERLSRHKAGRSFWQGSGQRRLVPAPAPVNDVQDRA